MQIHEVGSIIGTIIKKGLMNGYKKTQLAHLFSSNTAPIETIEKGGKLQFQTIAKVAASMRCDLLLVFVDQDEMNEEANKLREMVYANNTAVLNDIPPVLEKFIALNGHKTMKTGLVKKSKKMQEHTEKLMNIIGHNVIDSKESKELQDELDSIKNDLTDIIDQSE